MEDLKNKCGDCIFFGAKGCTTSYLEAKWGSFGTPACEEFIHKKLNKEIFEEKKVIKKETKWKI